MNLCKIPECDNKTFARGFCTKHYQRWYIHRDPLCTIIERHGMTDLPEYGVWFHMKNRCSNPNNNEYKYYGGRGITVCQRWKKSFKAFLEDMGSRPSPKHEIDRIDNDGNYEPENCRWAARIENIRNSRIVKLTMDKAREIRCLYETGKYSYREIAKMFGVTKTNICFIIRGERWKEAV